MKPIVTVEEMRQIDAEAQERVGLETLIERAGYAAAAQAINLLGGGYGRRVVLLAGKGNNGKDGRVASRLLKRRGLRVVEYGPGEAPEVLPDCDLVLDAVVGTGFHGSYVVPRAPTGSQVLALDIASGLDADTGVASPEAMKASSTVTFAGLKPGLLLGDGPEHSGEIHLADIGIDTSGARQHLVEDADRSWLAVRPRSAHKWQTAVRIVAGSPGMPGAAALCAEGALRAGVGMIRLASPGAAPGSVPVTEVVSDVVDSLDFASVLLADLGRFHAMVIGPGLGRAPATAQGIRQLIAEANVPLVLDADGLNALSGTDDLAKLVGLRTAPIVLTPHEGEFAQITGAKVGADRLAEVRALAQVSGATVLLKGSTTIVCDPGGEAYFANAGSPRLATGGTGDVLSGVIAAFLARGVAPARAAALGAHVHGRAATAGRPEGLVASDLPQLVSGWLSATSSDLAAEAEPQ